MARSSRAAVAKGKKDDDDEKKKQPAPARRNAKKDPPGRKRAYKSRKIAVPNKAKDKRPAKRQKKLTYQQIVDRLPFCCAVCHCPERIKQLIPENFPWVAPGEDTLDHRRCCHGVIDDPDENWCPPYFDAQEKAYSDETTFPPEEELVWVGEQQIQAAFHTSVTQDTEVRNVDGIVDNRKEFEVEVLRYHKLVQDVKSGRSARRGCVVLDCYAGVGTGVLVLKRLKIQVAKVIHVEHDKVATHVYRSNHDHYYNSKLPDDGVEHVFIEEFEELTGNVKKFWNDHGPIDLVLGGPPCVDCNIVKANRIGVKARREQYMVQLAKFIRELERLQKPHPLWFFVENTILEEDDLRAVRDALGVEWGPIELDALHLSPIRRKRHYFFNFPMQNIDPNGPAAKSSPDCCLLDGFDIPATLHQNSREASKDIAVAKAKCFMSLASRTDDVNSLRMFVFNPERNESGDYHGRPSKIVERENLMGFPEGYVERYVEELFERLQVDALSHLHCADDPWKQTLEQKYHVFAGNYHKLPLHNLSATEYSAYQFEATSPCNFVAKLAPPCTKTSTPIFLGAEDYSKHLIGSAFSVPVIEALLKPLQPFFLSKSYSSFEYHYKWEPQPSTDSNNPNETAEVWNEDDDAKVPAVVVKAEHSANSQMGPNPLSSVTHAASAPETTIKYITVNERSTGATMASTTVKVGDYLSNQSEKYNDDAKVSAVMVKAEQGANGEMGTNTLLPMTHTARAPEITIEHITVNERSTGANMSSTTVKLGDSFPNHSDINVDDGAKVSAVEQIKSLDPFNPDHLKAFKRPSTVKNDDSVSNNSDQKSNDDAIVAAVIVKAEPIESFDPFSNSIDF